jgi:hypothetical protein
MKSLLVTEIQFHLSNRAQKAKVRSIMKFIKRLNKSLEYVSSRKLTITWNSQQAFYKVTLVTAGKLVSSSDIIFYPGKLTWEEVSDTKKELLESVQ